ncbi:MAG: ABC transporter ATP-binding protein [Kangiellaceae bacterium]|nr:ABC transporter ATP-binding protein [Kangiellaceae bacterium]
MDNISLNVSQLVKNIGSQQKIGELDFVIGKGAKVALLGLNGAGKSSLIRLLVGENQPTSGAIEYLTSTHTFSPTHKEFKSSLGYQADTMLSINQMCVSEYLAFCAAFKNLAHSTLPDEILDLMELWGVLEAAGTDMSKLSKGNLQKLAIAQAFLGEPKWLFFDEPCQSLDPIEQDRFNSYLKRLTNIELCVFSTHNVQHALDVADEIILIHQAKIVYQFRTKQSKDYLLCIAELNASLDHQILNKGINFEPIGYGIYRLHQPKHETIKLVDELLEQSELVNVIFLPEREALMPLFRLLASGEIELEKSEIFTARVDKEE